MINFFSKAQYVASIQDVNDLKNPSKARVILLGDSILGIFDTGIEDESNSGGLDSKYIKQKTRSASSFTQQISNSNNNKLHLYADKSISEALKNAGIRSNKIFLAADSILRHIKIKTLGKSGVILCCSPLRLDSGERHGVLVEEYSYSNGELLSFTERRFDQFIFPSEILKSVKESYRAFPANTLVDLSVCGPSAHSAINALEEFSPSDITKSIFNFLGSSNFVSDEIKKDKTVPYILTIIATMIISMLIIHNGKSNLIIAQKQYHQNVDGFVELYTQGRAPLELIEKRSIFMDNLIKSRAQAYRLPELISAVAKVKIQMPTINLVAEQISYIPTSLMQDAQTTQKDYFVVLKFDRINNVTPEEELAQWQSVFRNFSNHMKGTSQVLESPITLNSTTDKQVLVMTITGNFEVTK